MASVGVESAVAAVPGMSSVANLVPSVRKHVSQDIAEGFVHVDFFAPGAVDVRRSTGGFSSAVQVAATHCLQLYASQLDTVGVVARRWGSRLQAELEPIRGSLTDSWWQSFAPAPNEPYGIGYVLEPRELRFPSIDQIAITFEGSLALYCREVPFTPPDFVRPNEWLPYPIDLPHRLQTGPRTPDADHLGPFTGAPLMADARMSGIREAQLPREYPHPVSLAQDELARATVGDPALQDVPLRVERQFDGVRATLLAGLRWVAHAPQKSVDIYLDLREAKLTLEPEAGDTTTLYESFVVGRIHELEALVAPVGELALAPTISLVGRNAANANVPELPDFDVRVFPVADRSSRQAICAAFDVVPGCVGIIEDVSHFIGGSDYGAIHNEYVVERVLHHKWNRGGFDRSVGISRRVTLRVKRNGQDRDEDALVYGRLELDTLDTVALEADPDLRRDFLLLGGSAQGIADRVVMVSDGTTLTPENADLGPPEPVGWGVNLDPSLHPTWSADPELRQFQRRAHSDGVRHLTRPFARHPQIGGGSVDYVRTEAIKKRFFVLGSLGLFR